MTEDMRGESQKSSSYQVSFALGSPRHMQQASRTLRLHAFISWEKPSQKLLSVLERRGPVFTCMDMFHSLNSSDGRSKDTCHGVRAVSFLHTVLAGE